MPNRFISEHGPGCWMQILPMAFSKLTFCDCDDGRIYLFPTQLLASGLEAFHNMHFLDYKNWI